jgi:hypothetical protein
MKHLKKHPINDKAQKLSKMKKEDIRKAKEKKISAEKDLAEKPKMGRAATDPSNKKLDGERFLAESLSLGKDKVKDMFVEFEEMDEYDQPQLHIETTSGRKYFVNLKMNRGAGFDEHDW